MNGMDLLAELNDINARTQVQADLARVQGDYAKTLSLLRHLKAGTVSLDDVTLQADGWAYRLPVTPAVVNGTNGEAGPELAAELVAAREKRAAENGAAPKD